MSEKYWPVKLSNHAQVDFLTDAAGVLRVGPGKTSATFRLDFHHRGKERCDILSCVTRLADATGKVWEAEAVFTPAVFMEKLLDLNRYPWTDFFESAEQDRKDAFTNASLLEDVGDLYDDRFYRYFLVGAAVIHVQFKYLSPNYDIAYLDSRRVVVRVRGLWGSWDSLTFEEGDVAGVQEAGEAGRGNTWGDIEEVPAIAYELETRELLFRNLACPEVDSPDCWHDNDVPLPLKFRRTSGGGEPQEHVRFVPFAEL